MLIYTLSTYKITHKLLVYIDISCRHMLKHWNEKGKLEFPTEKNRETKVTKRHFFVFILSEMSYCERAGISLYTIKKLYKADSSWFFYPSLHIISGKRALNKEDIGWKIKNNKQHNQNSRENHKRRDSPWQVPRIPYTTPYDSHNRIRRIAHLIKPHPHQPSPNEHTNHSNQPNHQPLKTPKPLKNPSTRK